MGSLKTRLKKFAQCYKLFTANRELCPHEVHSLILRCHSYGNWLPVNFPNESLPRKFHMLTYIFLKRHRRISLLWWKQRTQVKQSVHFGISGPECMPQFRIKKYGCHWQLASNGYTAIQTYLTWGKQKKEILKMWWSLALQKKFGKPENWVLLTWRWKVG